MKKDVHQKVIRETNFSLDLKFVKKKYQAELSKPMLVGSTNEFLDALLKSLVPLLKAHHADQNWENQLVYSLLQALQRDTRNLQNYKQTADNLVEKRNKA